jgi:hypothetical protein
MMSRMNSLFGRRPLPRAVRSEPFQLFVLHQGKVVQAQNPGSSYSDIMSLLGRMWQALPEEQKHFYALGAMSAMRDVPRRRRRTPVRTIEVSSDEIRIHASIQQQNHPEPLPLPTTFTIVSRAGFGQTVAIASQRCKPETPSSPFQGSSESCMMT